MRMDAVTMIRLSEFDLYGCACPLSVVTRCVYRWKILYGIYSTAFVLTTETNDILTKNARNQEVMCLAERK